MLCRTVSDSNEKRTVNFVVEQLPLEFVPPGQPNCPSATGAWGRVKSAR